eukprot:TRINITY_DN15743_c0_g1_i12.p1 TRINITY_DN15743_c0_g1~~TRINITY_DN15743_c0_g1_i12.p1  ORF type:complete len:376 (+),score=45.72 TRINITY_DN15743_c0_g1_i12:107-1234(+)
MGSASEKISLFYVSLPNIEKSTQRESYEKYTKYYSKGHNKLLTADYFPVLDVEQLPVSQLIGVYFGVTEFIYLEVNAKYGSVGDAKAALSALQVAVEDNAYSFRLICRMQIPVFAVGYMGNSEIPIIYGYLSHFLMYTIFDSITIAERNISKEYPTISSLLSLGDVRKVAPYKMQLRYYHRKVYNKDNSHFWFNGNDSSESILLISRKEIAIESETLPSFITSKNIGEFIRAADEIQVQIKIETTRTAKFLRKLSFCSTTLKQHQISKTTLLAKPPLYDNIFDLRDILTTQKSTISRWDGQNTKIHEKVVERLNKIRPCEVTSLYGAVLKQIYTNGSESYVKEGWQVFTTYLREQWDGDKDFSLYFLVISMIDSK